MEAVILFLAAFVSLVLLFAQVKMFSVDATLKEILTELQRTRLAIEKQSIPPVLGRDTAEPSPEDNAVGRLDEPEVSPKHQEILAPWQRDIR